MQTRNDGTQHANEWGSNANRQRREDITQVRAYLVKMSSQNNSLTLEPMVRQHPRPSAAIPHCWDSILPAKRTDQARRKLVSVTWPASQHDNEVSVV